MRLSPMVIISSAILLSCGDDSTGPSPVAIVTVAPGAPSVVEGSTVQLTATARDAQGNVLADRTFTWTSGTTSVATVSDAGLVTAVSPGTSVVGATSEGQTGTATVTVTRIPVATVSLSTLPSLDVGETGQLTATLKDAQGNVLSQDDRIITWTSGSTSIATVNSSGLVSAVAPGSTEVTATSEGKQAAAAITVVAPTPFLLSDISVGGSHACGLTDAGEAWCWGENGNGELGDGTFTKRTRPVRVLGSHVFTSISAGGVHTCALKASGEAWCWGDNLYGSLGDATFVDKQTPAQVSGGHAFESLTAGAFHTCARTAADVAWCWGNGDTGAIGDNGTFHRNAPVLVQGGLAFTQLSAGYYHTCGVAAGAAYCWGDNGGQVLPGITTGPGILGTGSTAGIVAQPAPVGGGLEFTEVAAALGFTCGRTATGALHCWGVNTYGNLGDGSTAIRTAPVAVSVAGSFLSIASGAFHGCARSSANEAWCWGRNILGQLGDGTTEQRTAPVKVAGATLFSRISADASTTCAIATDQQAWCWGNGGSGSLGNGTTDSRSTPGRVKP